ncbi:hypothetical protein ACFC08_11290 [Streptomyces sp. NPDC056112]|uniref:hypothetical protein n=2 Tax=Streptomyces TaxID=1883 RepID=UPI001CD5443F|nr:hypothetical protein [Streptomyces sp. CoT10]
MSNSPSPRPATPPTVWPARGRHTGPAAEDVVRRHLKRLKADDVIHDHLEPEPSGPGGEKVFEARWLVPGEVTVRARLALSPLAGSGSGLGREWVLMAEAEQPWDPRWPSPATMFWPQGPDAGWEYEAVTGLRLGEVTPLPDDDKELRRVLRHAARDTWTLHVVVHEAMTPDERGRAAVVRVLPEGLRHRVVEHRAAPHRFRAVNWVLDDFGVRLPRGGALVLPGSPPPPGYDAQDFSVRSVFLDGTEPTELIDAVKRFAALPRPLPNGADRALTALREEWQLLTPEEELARARELVTMYSEALEAMTKSRDLYREAAERAHEALAVYRESEAGGTLTAGKQARTAAGSPFQQLARGLGRLKGSALSLRPGATPERRPKAGAAPDDDGGSPAGGDAGTSPPAGGSKPRTGD